jgi:hypothetical protein
MHGKQGVRPSADGTRGILSAGEWKVLPAEGRKGDVPAWPLPAAGFMKEGLWKVDPVRVRREAEVWADLWKTPQAMMWEEQGQHHEVALYVRTLCEAEVSHAPVTTRVEARRGMEALGLSVPGLLRNRWKIDPAPIEDDDGTTPDGEPAKPTRLATARDRLRVVDPPGETG